MSADRQNNMQQNDIDNNEPSFPYEPTIKIKQIFSANRIICRLLAAWSIYISFSIILVTLFGLSSDNSNSILFFDKLGFNQNIHPIIPILSIALLFTALSFAASLLYKYNSDSWFLLAGATVCAMLWSGLYTNPSNKFTFWLALGAAYSIFLIWIMHENEALLEKFKFGRKTMLLSALGFGLFSCVVISAITCLRYTTFSSPNYDFGIFVNMFHNMKETGLPLVSCERDMILSHFAVHISPIYYLLLPFYALFSSPLTLQIAQAVILMLGVIPVVLLSRHYGLSERCTVVMSALYAFYTAISTGCFFDIHENCFLPLLLLLTFLFFEKKKPIPMYICVILTLCVKEDAAIYLLVFAFYILLSRKEKLHGAVIAALSLVYFTVAGFILEKYGLGMMVDRYGNLILDQDDGLLGAIKTVLLNPGYALTQLFTTADGGYNKVAYFLYLLLPVGFAPFLTKKASRWLLLAPLLINLLTMYPYQYEIGFQYSFGISAFLFYAAIQNISEITPAIRKNIISVAIAFALTLYILNVGQSLGYYVGAAINYGDEYERLEEILDTVPEDASVCCSTFLLPHIADRSEIYEIEYHGGKGDVDYVVLDARSESYLELMLPYTEQGYVEYFYEENMILILVSPELLN